MAVETSAMFLTWPVRFEAMEFTESVKIFPRTSNTRHLRLTAELSVGSHFAGHARYFAGERVELVHHRVERVFEFEDFAFHVDGDLAAQDRRGPRLSRLRRCCGPGR